MKAAWIEIKDQRGKMVLIDASRILAVRDYGDYRDISLRRGGGETLTIGSTFTFRQIVDLVGAAPR